MTTKNNVVIDISEKLRAVRKEHDKEYGVMFSESFDSDRTIEGVPTHIEVYEDRGYLTGFNVTIDGTSTLIMLASREAIELGQALFQAACSGTE